MTTLSLFPSAQLPHSPEFNAAVRAPLGQYLTPAWAAEALVEHFMLALSDVVLEPTCGAGHFLQAIPAAIPALGVELDESLADEARRRTGRHVITADVLSLELPDGFTPTVVIGNLPFSTAFIDRLLMRAHEWLPEGGRCGLIVPAYAFQYASTIVRHAERWSLAQDMLPRDLWPRLSTPIVFARFEKVARGRTLVGFALYRELDAVKGLAPWARTILTHGGPQPTWRMVVERALADLGGEASLARLFETIEGRRPTPNRFWREKVRQTAQRYCRRTGKGRYALRREEQAA